MSTYCSATCESLESCWQGKCEYFREEKPKPKKRCKLPFSVAASYNDMVNARVRAALTTTSSADTEESD